MRFRSLLPALACLCLAAGAAQAAPPAKDAQRDSATRVTARASSGVSLPSLFLSRLWKDRTSTGSPGRGLFGSNNEGSCASATPDTASPHRADRLIDTMFFVMVTFRNTP